MKKVKRRAASVLVVVAVMVLGLGVYVYRLARDGRDWASFVSNQAVYVNGVLSVGTVYDRDGDVLAAISPEGRSYSDSAAVRRATLHAVGDRYGYIGTGALRIFASKLIGYDIISGAYSADGSGGKVRLSIDADLNVAAFDALGGMKGAVGVMDCRTGELLCMVSSPSFDPDDPPESVEGEEYEGVYLNRFLSAAYTPGSTFKLVTLAAALENIDDIYDRTFECSGSREVDGSNIVCTRAHGTMTIEDALAYSCNCTFAGLALELGGGTIQEYAEKYGLLDGISVDGVQTASGGFDAAADGTADLAWSGVGQYNDMVNPASMLRFMSAIANGGAAAEPTQLRSKLTAKTKRIMKESTADALSEMMNYNVHVSYGEDNFPGLELHAKSGTAEVGGGEPHAWFVGFAVKDGRTLAFVVVAENGGWGSSTAGAIANTVLQAAFANT